MHYCCCYCCYCTISLLYFLIYMYSSIRLSSRKCVINSVFCVMPVETTVIVAERRMSYFVAGLTNDNPRIKTPVYKQYHHVQYNHTVPVSATASVSFPSSHTKYRYVIIQRQFQHHEALCIAEVKVFSRGMISTCIDVSHNS